MMKQAIIRDVDAIGPHAIDGNGNDTEEGRKGASGSTEANKMNEKCQGSCSQTFLRNMTEKI